MLESKLKLRAAAEKVVDLMQAYNPSLIILSRSNSSPVLALVQALWEKKFKDKPFPKVKPMDKVSPLEVADHRVAIFHEVVKTGKTLTDAREELSEHGPTKVKLFGLLHAYHFYPSRKGEVRSGPAFPIDRDIVVGGRAYVGSSGDMGKGMVAAMQREINKQHRRVLSQELKEKEAELREMAYSKVSLPRED
ncbi:MAG: hypothetical protein Q8R15_02755 [Candidatus Micrarchaeota archaeon]|nr:hypothetical protein [Candidatus Micrarchaeota archaeon]